MLLHVRAEVVFDTLGFVAASAVMKYTTGPGMTANPLFLLGAVAGLIGVQFVSLERTRVPIRIGERAFGRFVDARPGHAEIPQASARPDLSGKSVQRLRRIAAEHRRQAGDHVGDGGRVIGQSVRQYDRVGLGVRQIECAAQCVAELVVQRHTDRAEAGCAQPCAVECIAPRGAVERIGGDRGEGGGELGDPVERHQRHDRIAIARIERFDGMGDGVDPARARERRRQGERQIDVVDHHLGHHPRTRLRALRTAFRFPQDRRHLGPGISGRDDDLRQIRAQRDRLAEADGRSAADRDDPVGGQGLDDRHRLGGHLDRGVHDGAGEHSGAAIAQLRGDGVGVLLLRRGCQYDYARQTEATDLVRQRRQRARSEDHSGRIGLIDEFDRHQACPTAGLAREAACPADLFGARTNKIRAR